MQHTPNLIIGAGPAGLAIAGRLSKMEIPYVLLEQSNQVCNSWKNHYDRLHLHTIKEYSYLPHMPLPADYPQYVPRKQICAYYDTYVVEMGITPLFGKTVSTVKRVGDFWETHTEDGTGFTSDNVIVCTGFNRVVNTPKWPGMDEFQGEIQHSRLYKNGKGFEGKKVLVVGMGNTGAELTIDLHEHGATPFISVRGPVNIVRRDFMGRPTQKTAIMLGKLPTWLGDGLGTFLSKVTVGNLSRYGIERRKIAPAAQLRTLGKTPVIDVGTIDLLKKGILKALPGIDHFEANHITFTDGQRLPFDAVILATGYRAQVEDFIEDTSGILNEHKVPKALWVDEHPGLYFLGFDAYASGLLYVAMEDSEKIADRIITKTS